MVFVLWHDQDRDNPLSETEKLIGIFSSEATTAAAINDLRQLPGFRRFPDAFIVDPWQLDDPGWEAGFATMDSENEWVDDPDPDGA